MDGQEVLQRVLGFLAERFPSEAELTPSTSLGNAIVIDSLATLEIVMFLEQEYGLSLDQADLEFLDTPARITELILRKA